MSRSGRGTRICVLASYPRLGEVLTHLVPPLSAEEALALHDRLARNVVRRALALVATGDARVEVRTDAAFHRVAHEWLGGGFSTRYQGEGDRGDRIRLAFGDAFAAGERRVVAVGSDCPRLAAAHIREALARLEKADVVLGPATGGGIYLVALRKESAKRSVPVLFSGIPWGTPEVLDRVLEIADSHGLTSALLETLPCVDTPDDIADAEHTLAAVEPSPTTGVTVVIPTLDGAELVATAVRSALAAGAAQVIVVGVAPGDETRAAASTAGALALDGPPDHAGQLNAGAKAATGNVLIFLGPGDTLPPDACVRVRNALSQPGVVGGALAFAQPARARHDGLLCLSRRALARLTRNANSDQALFVSAAVFRDVEGFTDVAGREKSEFVARLKRFGTVRILREPAVTSSRGAYSNDDSRH